MTYKEKITELTKLVNSSLIDFSEERKHNSPPTQVSSEFLINKEQGDWAEITLLNGINRFSNKYVAVKYGRNDDIIAGDDGFKRFYEEYQIELDEIGKRPDILIFEKKDYPFNTFSISNLERKILDDLVPKAKCGIEVRSSAYLINKYEEFMNKKVSEHYDKIMRGKEEIINNYSELLKSKNIGLFNIISSICNENIHVIDFTARTWKTSKELEKLSSIIKEIKENLHEIQKRTYLSITPKVEDIKVVYNWIKKYNVPHYYVQVFFDEAYGISFEKILTYISKPELEDVEYFLEADTKNQNKTTIKISAKKQIKILDKISLPEHYSEMKELSKGRLLYYVKFKNSISTISKEGVKNLVGIEL